MNNNNTVHWWDNEKKAYNRELLVYQVVIACQYFLGQIQQKQ